MSSRKSVTKRMAQRQWKLRKRDRVYKAIGIPHADGARVGDGVDALSFETRQKGGTGSLRDAVPGRPETEKRAIAVDLIRADCGDD